MSLEQFNNINNKRSEELKKQIDKINSSENEIDFEHISEQDFNKLKEELMGKINSREYEIEEYEKIDLVNIAHKAIKEHNFTEERKEKLKQEFNDIIKQEEQITKEYIEILNIAKLDNNNKKDSYNNLNSKYQEYLNKILDLKRKEQQLFNEEMKEVDQQAIEELESIEENKIDPEYEMMLRRDISTLTPTELRDRESVVMNDINNRAGQCEDNDFTDLEEYIKAHPLFREHDKVKATQLLNMIKERNPEKSVTVEDSINLIKNNITTKNLFRIYLMIKGYVGQQETNRTNSISGLSFEKIVQESKKQKDIASIYSISNKQDVLDYLKEPFNPEDYKKRYREFTEQNLLAGSKNNIRKNIKITSLIQSKEWDEQWKKVI